MFKLFFFKKKTYFFLNLFSNVYLFVNTNTHKKMSLKRNKFSALSHIIFVVPTHTHKLTVSLYIFARPRFGSRGLLGSVPAV